MHVRAVRLNVCVWFFCVVFPSQMGTWALNRRVRDHVSEWQTLDLSYSNAKAQVCVRVCSNGRFHFVRPLGGRVERVREREDANQIVDSLRCNVYARILCCVVLVCSRLSITPFMRYLIHSHKLHRSSLCRLRLLPQPRHPLPHPLHRPHPLPYH